MSNKKYDHWCDKQYQNPEDKDGNKRYIIGELAHSNYATLEQYLFNSWIGSFSHDMTKWEIDKIYSIKEMAKCKMQKY